MKFGVVFCLVVFSLVDNSVQDFDAISMAGSFVGVNDLGNHWIVKGIKERFSFGSKEKSGIMQGAAKMLFTVDWRLGLQEIPNCLKQHKFHGNDHCTMCPVFQKVREKCGQFFTLSDDYKSTVKNALISILNPKALGEHLNCVFKTAIEVNEAEVKIPEFGAMVKCMQTTVKSMLKSAKGIESKSKS